MLAAISAGDITAIAGLTVVCLSVGSAIGRQWGTTKKQRAAELAVEKAAEYTVQQLTYAVTGKPADQWGPKEPGLIEQMTRLREDFRQHINEEALAKAATALADKASGHELTPGQYSKLIELLEKAQ